MIMIGMAGVCLTVLAPVCPLTISLPSGTHSHSTDTLHTLSYDHQHRHPARAIEFWSEIERNIRGNIVMERYIRLTTSRSTLNLTTLLRAKSETSVK